MDETLSGFPFWVIQFDEDGKLTNAATEASLAQGAGAQQLTDLYIFSHGWNNSPNAAMMLYKGFFAQLRQVLDDNKFSAKRPGKVGVAGVVWPSILWPDEMPDGGGGAASLGGAATDEFTEIRKLYPDAAQQAVLDDLERMLKQRKRSDAALLEFLGKLRELSQAAEGTATAKTGTDNIEQSAITQTQDDWRDVLQTLAEGEENTGTGGAAGFGDVFDKLWNGAKGALRVTTYWQMKDRAGVVGKNGLGPLIGRLHQKLPELRIHLIGHSFGARLVSFSLLGLPEDAMGAKSPVKSLLLLQGAFSHFSFAEKLPFDARRSGDLKGMAARVDGPLVTTHSLKDLAVGRAYPLASFVAQQDAAAREVDRWGAMGNDGAQAVDAAASALGKPGTTYPFSAGKWCNLDGNKVIVNGGPPSGAHSDIVHPHTAWVALVAAGLR